MQTLVIDDDEAFASVVVRRLGHRGHEARYVTGTDEANQALVVGMPDAVILDLRLEQTSGIDYLPELRGHLPNARIVVLSGFASIAATVAAMQRGACDVLSKPADIASLDAALRGQKSGSSPVIQPLSPARAEWEHIQRVLHENDGNISATARSLGMHRRTLQRKLLKHAPR